MNAASDRSLPSDLDRNSPPTGALVLSMAGVVVGFAVGYLFALAPC